TPAEAGNETTWPSACTPASVRPATERSGAAPRSLPSASRITPSTVRIPGCLAQPWKSVPSYARRSLTTVIEDHQWRSGLLFGEQLDEGHGRTIALALSQLQDPGVAARPLREAGPDLGEQLVHDVSVRDRLQDLAARMHVAPFGERDEV